MSRWVCVGPLLWSVELVLLGTPRFLASTVLLRNERKDNWESNLMGDGKRPIGTTNSGDWCTSGRHDSSESSQGNYTTLNTNGIPRIPSLHVGIFYSETEEGLVCFDSIHNIHIWVCGFLYTTWMTMVIVPNCHIQEGKSHPNLRDSASNASTP